MADKQANETVRNTQNFTGCGTALVTPFRVDGALDEPALRLLVRRQVDAGVDFLCPSGTTGESPTLTEDEQLRVIRITVEEAGGSVPVLAGAGGYNTRHIVDLVHRIERIGANGILSVTPYYNKPTQEGVFQHYQAIASETSLPIVLYNVPGRTNVNLEPATVERLAAISNVAGIKEASGSLSQMAAVLSRVPDNFLVLAGDDSVTVPLIAIGGHGVISVLSNIIPREWTELTRSALNGHFFDVRSTIRRYQPLVEVAFIETNPGPVKAALASMGLLQPVWRLPLVPPSSASQARIEAVLEAVGIAGGVRV